jgi:hypothetical protein
VFFWRAENQLFFFVFLKERNEEESSGEEAILFEEVFLLTAHTFAESRHKLYVTKYHPLKQ